MIIQSIRLKNIKSYGNGPDGTGITIPFQTGVNRVAGRNGHGKTTLIESLGYALFLTDPQFEENFQIETYFLSYGSKEGEIDVTFEFEGESFRIERAVGKQSKRRSKVIQLSDQSICAEGDQEVADFLCRLLKFPDPKHLSDVFCKLVGVKQGRLTWPFDSKPAEAKRYFEPLLDVDVFRNCFERLKSAVDIFEAQRVEHQTKLAGINERVQDRADSPLTLASTRQKVEISTNALAEVTAARDSALKLKEENEVLAKAVETARNAQGSATQKLGYAKTLRDDAELRLAESKTAVGVLTENQVAHAAHIEAVSALEQLEKQREKRDGIQKQRDKAEAERVNHLSKHTAAQDQAKEFRLQGDAKQLEADALAGCIAPLKAALEASANAFGKLAGEAETAQDHRDAVGGWVDGLESLAGTQKRGAETVARLAKEISEWDKARLTAAEQVESDTAGALKAAQVQLAKAEERHATLKVQLGQISGGDCPFLKEKCRQFDPAKIQADLEQQALIVTNLKTEAGRAKTSHQKAQSELSELRKSQGKIAGKEAELSRAVAGYVDGSESLVPETVAEALAWLVAWEPQIAMMPQPPKLPTENLGPQTVADVQQQFEAFVHATETWWESSDDKIKARLKAFNEEVQTRRTQEITLSQSSEQLVRIQKEIQGLGQKAAVKDAESKQHEALAESTAAQIVKLDEALRPFANLADELKREQQKLDLNRGGHDRYLGAKKLADDLDIRQARLTQLLADEAAAMGALQKANEALEKAEQNFHPEKLRAAREDHQTKHDRATELKVSLESEKQALKKEEKRFQEWQDACKERDRVTMEIGRCEAARELTELARRTLRDTAPAVAQHLCSRIAKRAQGVYNQINPDPIELAWDSDRYSLRVTPGDRRFAMLSGGEQTKLALAMTLAMIEEFSGLRFCVFDEPTYAVDADSRQKLADAIIQAQEAAGLDQLILVSHDDAFEGKIEHAILLEKSASLGTAMVLAQ